MNKKVNLIFNILGIIFIVLGIVLTIIPLFKFDSDTFKLSSALLSGIGFPFVGIMLIVISTILGITEDSNSKENNATNTKIKKSKTSDDKSLIKSDNIQQENISDNLEESNK